MGKESTGWAWLLGRLGADANGDTRVTVADVPSWLVALFFLPGDAALFATVRYAPSLAGFLEVGSQDYGGLLSGFVSACAWIAAFLVAAILVQKLRDGNRRATAGVGALAAGAARQLRIAHALLKQRLRARRSARNDTRGDLVDYATDVELSQLELRALALHFKLKPGYALPVNDAAHGLGLRLRETEDLLAKLKSHGLLSRTLGGGDGETAYTLAAPGRALLVMRRLAPPAKS
jgi:hypothetical protein